MRVNKTNFHMKGFTLGLALKQRRNATRKLPIGCEFASWVEGGWGEDLNTSDFNHSLILTLPFS